MAKQPLDPSMQRILDKAEMLLLLDEFSQRCAHSKECNIYGNPLNGLCICGLAQLRERLSTIKQRWGEK